MDPPQYPHRHYCRRSRGQISPQSVHHIQFDIRVVRTSLSVNEVYYPAPGRYRERGIVFARFLCLFVCLFVSLSARLQENGWTDLHEIFRKGVE